MQKLLFLYPGLHGSEPQVLCDLPDTICSIAFCKIINSVFFSDMQQNTISIFNVNDQTISPWINGHTSAPKGIYMNEKHDCMFFDDDVDVFNGYWIGNRSHVSLLGKSAMLWLKPVQERRTTSSNHLQRKKHFCYCDYYKNAVVVGGDKNRVYRVDRRGVHKDIIGSGKQGFCLGSTPQAIELNNPMGVVYMPFSKTIAVADTNNHVVRFFNIQNTITELSLAGMPLQSGCVDDVLSKATFSHPSELCACNNKLYVIDGCDCSLLREIDLDAQKVTTIHQTPFITSITCSDDKIFFLVKG